MSALSRRPKRSSGFRLIKPFHTIYIYTYIYIQPACCVSFSFRSVSGHHTLRQEFFHIYYEYFSMIGGSPFNQRFVAKALAQAKASLPRLSLKSRRHLQQPPLSSQGSIAETSPLQHASSIQTTCGFCEDGDETNCLSL